MSGLLPDAGWQVAVFLLLLESWEQLLLLRGNQGERSFVSPKEEVETNSLDPQTNGKKERRVFEEKNCSYCWEVWTRSFWGRDWFSWKSSDCATSPPVATSIFGEAEGDHCREGEGSAHLQPAGWCSSSCPICCQEGDDIKVRVLLLAGVGNRPACVPWDESRLQGHLSCLPCEGDWDWWLWGVQPWAGLHHRQEIWRPPKPEVQVLPMNAKPLNVLILIASCVVLFNARYLDIVQQKQTIVIKMIKKIISVVSIPAKTRLLTTF